MRMGWIVPALVACAAAAWGCGSGGSGTDTAISDTSDVPAGTDESADPAPADLPEDPGADAPDDVPPGDVPADSTDLPVKAEAPILLLEKAVADTAWGADPQFPLDRGRGSPHVRVSACGTVGVLFRDVLKSADGSFDSSVVVQVFDATGDSAPPRGYLATASKTAAPLETAGTVIFSGEADGCRPLVWRASDTRPGYDLWTRKDDGTWQSLEAPLGLELALGKVPTALRHVAGDVDGLGQLHLLFEATLTGGDTAMVHAWVKDGAWTVSRFPLPVTDGGCFGYAFARGGALHAACRQGLDIVHGTLDGADWTFTTAVTAVDAGTDLKPASIALGGYDVPLIAYTRLQRIEDGPDGSPSYAYAQLGLATRSQDGAWSTEVLAQESDGYVGGDGKRFTGWMPSVAVPIGSGGIHVAFSDIAASHRADGVQELDPGQARYAFRTGSDWKYATILRQRLSGGTTRSDLGWNPLMGVSPGGKQAAFLVLDQERARDLPLDGPAPGTIRLLLIRTSR